MFWNNQAMIFIFPLIYRQPLPSWTHWSNPSSSKGFLSFITLRNSPSYSLSHATTIPKNSILHRLPWPIFFFSLSFFFSFFFFFFFFFFGCVKGVFDFVTKFFFFGVPILSLYIKYNSKMLFRARAWTSCMIFTKFLVEFFSHPQDNTIVVWRALKCYLLVLLE